MPGASTSTQQYTSQGSASQSVQPSDVQDAAVEEDKEDGEDKDEGKGEEKGNMGRQVQAPVDGGTENTGAAEQRGEHQDEATEPDSANREQERDQPTTRSVDADKVVTEDTESECYEGDCWNR